MARILLVDDEPEILKLTKRMLEREGHRVICASDGEEGLGILRNEKPDLILLDVRMPNMDGWKVCERIKSDERLGDIPVVMFTVRTSAEDKERSWECGADAQLDKPFTRKELCEKVKSLLE